jgi:aldehyde dehydrogenase (NAD+)
MIERSSVGNLKRTWVNYGKIRDWFDSRQGEGWEFLRQSVQVKNIWVPYGE